MSEQSGGEGWWLASDGRWYPPESHPDAVGSLPPPPATGAGISTGPQTTNGFAIASMVLGIVWIYWIGSILALIFGYKARKEIDASNGRQGGRGMAVAGIVLGWIGVAVIGVVVVAIIATAVLGSNAETNFSSTGYDINAPAVSVTHHLEGALVIHR